MGNGAWGIAASRVYFSKQISQLTIDERLY